MANLKTDKMDGAHCVAVLAAVIPVMEYLEKLAQGDINADADVIAQDRKEGKDADASLIFLSQKQKVVVSKAVAAINKAGLFAQAVQQEQEKQAAIEAQAVKPGKVLTMTTPVKA